MKAIMNNKVGLKNLFEHKEALTLLARYVHLDLLLMIFYFLCRSITPTLPLVMLEAVKLMAAVCLVTIFLVATISNLGMIESPLLRCLQMVTRRPLKQLQ